MTHGQSMIYTIWTEYDIPHGQSMIYHMNRVFYSVPHGQNIVYPKEITSDTLDGQ
jgi:hypothetical protein